MNLLRKQYYYYHSPIGTTIPTTTTNYFIVIGLCPPTAIGWHRTAAPLYGAVHAVPAGRGVRRGRPEKQTCTYF